jgi:hypothetical protein
VVVDDVLVVVVDEVVVVELLVVVVGFDVVVGCVVDVVVVVVAGCTVMVPPGPPAVSMWYLMSTLSEPGSSNVRLKDPLAGMSLTGPSPSIKRMCELAGSLLFHVTESPPLMVTSGHVTHGI